MNIGDKVKFREDSRNGDWRKGQIATISKVIATPPQNQNTIYIVWWKGLLDTITVWATEKDLEQAWDQLTIFDALDELAKAEASSGNE